MKRILGDLRIFQSVVNDRNLYHNHAESSYLYDGIDPYQLEDSSFPITVGAIEKAISDARTEVIDRIEANLAKVENHVCWLNDGEQVCYCYKEAADDILKAINDTRKHYS